MWGNEERRNYKGRVTLQTYQLTVLIDITQLMPLITLTPIRMSIADGNVLPGQREAFEAASELKSFVELKGYHYSLYTTAKEVAIASPREWFVEYLTT